MALICVYKNPRKSLFRIHHSILLFNGRSFQFIPKASSFDPGGEFFGELVLSL
jgi:hypothetical protein